jgi:hypothetical protein
VIAPEDLETLAQRVVELLVSRNPRLADVPAEQVARPPVKPTLEDFAELRALRRRRGRTQRGKTKDGA